jgi:hypothetical protein
MRYASYAAFTALLLMTGAASAQTQPPVQNVEQYPSYIETSNTAQDGTELLIRCGYGENATGIIADPTYMEFSTLNQASGSYVRYQRINTKMVVTIPAQGNNQNGNRFLIEVVEPNGTAIAKNCLNNAASDTINSCIPAQPFMPPAQVATQDQSAATQCGAFLGKALPQLNRFTYSAPKTQIFKNNLSEKVTILEAP